ncbi:MAG: hypothetical protein MJ066_05370 [Clostridia bacterium]|nr:hypothetical protein [Clostridia bacterium]
MAAFITAITDVMTGIFSALITALSSVGGLIFTIGESGAITGVEPFGYLLAVLVGVPAGAWVFSKLWGVVRSIRLR